MRTSFVVAAALTAVSVAAAGAVWAADSVGEHHAVRGLGQAGFGPDGFAPSVPATAGAAAPDLSAVIRSTARAMAGEAQTPTPRPGDPGSGTPAKAIQPVHSSVQPVHAGVQPTYPAPPAQPRNTHPPGAAPPAPPSSANSIETAVFDMLNRERAANGLPALRWSNALAVSAALHNELMDANNSLNHQFPGEAPLQQREAAAGFRPSVWGENVGQSPQTDESGAIGLEQVMYDEAPSGGHRRNILSSGFGYVGISVIIDNSTGSLWLTEDFGG